MSEEQKRLIEETVENLKHLDKESLLVVKGSVEVLKARDAIVVRSGGTFDDATGSTTLLTISKSSMTNAIDQVYEGGMLAKTGRAEFSDGTYLDIKNGRIVGGNTKEGGTF